MSNRNFVTGQNEWEETTQNTTVTKSAACASFSNHWSIKDRFSSLLQGCDLWEGCDRTQGLIFFHSSSFELWAPKRSAYHVSLQLFIDDILGRRQTEALLSNSTALELTDTTATVWKEPINSFSLTNCWGMTVCANVREERISLRTGITIAVRIWGDLQEARKRPHARWIALHGELTALQRNKSFVSIYSLLSYQLIFFDACRLPWQCGYIWKVRSALDSLLFWQKTKKLPKGRPRA